MCESKPKPLDGKMRGGYAGPKRVQILAGEEAQDWARELNGNYV